VLGEPMLYHLTAEAITRARISELRDWLDPQLARFTRQRRAASSTANSPTRNPVGASPQRAGSSQRHLSFEIFPLFYR
jgi:hypothetical protein